MTTRKFIGLAVGTGLCVLSLSSGFAASTDNSYKAPQNAYGQPDLEGTWTNASLTVLNEATRGGLMSRSKELSLAEPFLDRLRLRFSSYDQPVSSLSGGNQQKVVLSKWLAAGPRGSAPSAASSISSAG